MKSFVRRTTAHVEVWRNLEEVSARAAQLFAEIAHACIRTSGAFKVALSGGSTPKALYTMLAAGVESAKLAASEGFDLHISWPQTHVFWSDERCVPPDDARSNYRMGYETLLAHVPVPLHQIHRMRGEDEPTRAAIDYAFVLEEEFGAGFPRFDLILLGMGEDGHTASLFPDSPALNNSLQPVAANYVEKFGESRLTFTFGTLNAAANIIFLVSGESKARVLRSVLEDNANSQALPAASVVPSNGRLLWLVDEAAAKLL